MISIVGLGDTAIKEARERVQAAREIQTKRFEKIEKVNCNAQISNSLIS